MPNETTDVSVVVPATKIGPPESPKQVPPVWFTPRLLENFAAMPFPAPNTPLRLTSFSFDLRRVSPPMDVCGPEPSRPYPTAVYRCVWSRISESSRWSWGSRPYCGRCTASSSTRTPASCRKNALGSNCGCGCDVARTHSGDAFSAADQAAYRPALLFGANVTLGGRMLKSGASLKLIHTSLPPDPVPPPAVVDAPLRPTPNVQ